MSLRRRLFCQSLVGAAIGKAAAPKPPNIVLFLADDHGWDIAGCYGNKVIRTPHIDRLAREGMRFTRAFAASPTCSPSRAVLYTGLHSARNGLMGNHAATHEGLQSIAQYLKALGYRTILANKTHVKPESVFAFEYVKATLPLRPDRPRKYRLEGLDTAAIDTLLADHVKTRGGQPLCLILADSAPHVLWEKNRDYDPAELPLPPITVDTPKTRTALANYYQDITTADQHLGEVLASLRRHGLEKDTLTIYTSDQGPEWPRSKWTLYDAGLRVPFIARWPGRIAPGAVTEAMISFVDVTPTLVDIAGGKPPSSLDGRSFQGVLTGKAKAFRSEIYASHSGDGTMNIFPQRCVRDLRYKYILNLHPERKWTTHFTQVEGIPDSHKDVYGTWLEKAKIDATAARLVEMIERHPREELYDTVADPHELTNLIDSPAAASVVARMRQRMGAMRTELRDQDE
ncbi:MAG: sulfatase [Bryobacterales bacterium]|nr:sulfatase [Bryobacterales bacterium]